MKKRLPEDFKAKEEWRNIDFTQLRKTQIQNMESKLNTINQTRVEKQGQNKGQVEQVEYLQYENMSIQKDLV